MPDFPRLSAYHYYALLPNRHVSQKRVFIEHVIRVIKIFRVAKQVFRMRSRMYEMVIACVCGLVRLRVQYA